MLHARHAVVRRSWSLPQEHSTEDWWADVLPIHVPADTRHHSRGALNIYRLRDEPRAIILVACTKCDWKAAYSRDELIALHGADRAMPNLLNNLAAPGAQRSAQTGIAAARILSSPLRGHDDHANHAPYQDDFILTGPDIEPA